MKEFFVYPNSVNEIGSSKIYMVKEKDADKLVIEGALGSLFEGRYCECCGKTIAPLTHKNADVLRSLFDWTAPKPVLRNKRSMGVGDRLGIACPGHIRVFNKYDMSPIFAQQSIRELNLTERTYEDVLDCVTFSVYREGFKRGFGADGDHLKTEKDIEYALGLKFSMITLDCSEHIRGDVAGMSDAEVDAECYLSEDVKAKYLGKTFTVEDSELTFTEQELKRIVLIYGGAIKFATYIYEKYIKAIRDKVDFELSIDETATPTTPLQHFFVAKELTDAGVGLVTVAPRFCGEFQKGIDYIGDLAQFESELKVHAAIARHFGYKLSIHSGSDKFSTFELIGKYTKGNFHVKTDIFDVHDYEQDPATFKAKLDPLPEGGTYNVHWCLGRGREWNVKPTFVSEYGGIRWAEEGAGWGYGNAPKTGEEFIERFRGLTDALLDNPMMGGLCYTQLTDVEQEVNGLYTYDRKPKFDPAVIRAINTQPAAAERE